MLELEHAASRRALRSAINIIWPISRNGTLTLKTVLGRAFHYIFTSFAVFFFFIGIVTGINVHASLGQKLLLAFVGFIGPFTIGRLMRRLLSGE